MNDIERAFLRGKNIAKGQAASTKACIERPKELDTEWLNRKIPKEAQVRDEEGNVFLNLRAITFQESKIEEGIRRDRGKRLAEIRNEPEPAPIELKRKMGAVGAFMNVFTVEGIKTKFKDLMQDVKKICLWEYR